jgi:hypothetical protein
MAERFEAAPIPSQGWLEPSRRRFAVALAAAALAFFVPQEPPLEFFPLNEPGNDVLYLQLTARADRAGDVQIYYDTGRGIREFESISWPISPSNSMFTYVFPLPDAPIREMRLDPVARGGTLEIQQLRIIDRRGAEIRRFNAASFVPLQQIAAIATTPAGWKIVSEPIATDPYARVQLAPVAPRGMTRRNLNRCVLSTVYLAVILWLLLIAVHLISRPAGGGRANLRTALFLAAIAILLSLVGNRGLITNTARIARSGAPPESFQPN